MIILPVSGLIHEVKKGETIDVIANKYKAEPWKILAFNEILNEEEILPGDILIIPEGKMPQSNNASPPPLSLAKHYFICPLPPPCKITQGLHRHGHLLDAAVDFSNGECGERVLAAAGGKVQKVKFTNSSSYFAFEGAGNHITILHPNNTVTFYGHLSKSFVKPGDEVTQGQIIALTGGKPGTPGAGISTGCHLHFAVFGTKNPFSYNSLNR